MLPDGCNRIANKPIANHVLVIILAALAVIVTAPA